MPLTHVQNQRRQSRQPEAEESGFTQAFTPPPGVPSATSETVERPVEQAPVTFAPPPAGYVSQSMPRPLGPTPQVRLIHQVSQYAVGSVVPAVCFPELERLLRIGAVEYTNELPSAQPIDETIAAGMSIAQPVAATGSIPRAPWIQASVQDILGPALPRTGVPKALHGFTMLQTETGHHVPVAAATMQAQPVVQPPAQPEGFADIQTAEPPEQ